MPPIGPLNQFTRHATHSFAYVVCLFLCSVSMGVIAQQDYDRVNRITSAAVLLDPSEQPPTDSAPWQPQVLPDNWNSSRPDSGGLAWYRASFMMNDTEDTQAIYINRASMNAAVYINGILIGSGGSFEEPVARNWNRPNFYVIPQPLLKIGENSIHVRLRVYPRTQGGLSVVEVGAERVLRARYANAFFVSVSLNQVVSLFTIALGITFFLLWTQRRSETVYLYFGLGMMLWGVHGLKLFVQTIPVSAYYWDVFTSLIIPVFTAILVPFVFRFTSRRYVWLERFGFIAVSALIASHALCGPGSFYQFATIGFAVSTLVSAPLLYLLARDAWQHPNSYRLLIAVAGAVCVGLAVHDLLWQKGLLDFEARPLLQYGGPLLFLGMGGELLSRFAHALTVAEKANVELEARVAQVTIELSANYRELNQLTRDHAMFDERQRIMRDMHDGIGGQLITAIAQVRTGDLPQSQLETILIEILDDLRLVIDSMQRTENDLASALGNFRYRIEPRLKGLGVALEWQLDDSADNLLLPPSGILHVLRIVQEAFTNIVKHSRATRVVVTSSTADILGKAYLNLIIRDNGIGSAGVNIGQGKPGNASHGLVNIISRARALGGIAEFISSAEGTCLALNIPLKTIRMV